MGEPEDLLVEAARVATIAARDLWRRARSEDPPRTLALERVRRRLEYLVAAVHGLPLPIVPAEPGPAPTWLARMVSRAPGRLAAGQALASTDGTRIRLPPSLDAPAGDAAATAAYRLLALEQAARAARGTPRLVSACGRGDLIADLYLLAEAAAVDRALAAGLPGLLPDLRAAREAALATRPPLDRLAPAERGVERLVRDLLAAHPARPPSPLPEAVTPVDSLAWARATARGLGADGRRYRGLPAVAFWGTATAPPVQAGAGDGDADAGPAPAGRAAHLRRRPAVREAEPDEDDERVGMWMVRWDDPHESVEDPMGLSRPTDRDDGASPDGLADSLAELPDARIVRTPDRPREALVSEDPPARPRLGRRAGGTTTGVVYPEWDWRLGAYRPLGAVVRPAEAPEGNDGWAARVLARHAPLVARLRRRFEALRPARVRLGRQLDGPEVDLSAYVTGFADRLAGWAVEERLYADLRPARRDIAILLLVDASASTDGWVAASRRIIDVEKEALVVIVEALDALGDPYAILAFSGCGPGAVSLLAVKAFAERRGERVHRRIAGLAPDRYTRCGAAIRHATALLGRQRAGHRLLLVLSDGKPNDVDAYEGRYGVEDTRQAVAEARLQGIHPFCLTVDREAPAYLPRVFGPGATTLLRDPERLPAALAEVVRHLVER